MQDYGYDEGRSADRRTMWMIVGGIVLAVVIGVGIWGVNVATSGVRGQGDAIIQKNSAANWTKAQREFEDQYAHIEATDRKVTIAAERLAKDPDDRTAEDNYYGAQTVCQSQVADYNALARTFTAEDFRSADLPPQIDATNPLTDCKE